MNRELLLLVDALAREKNVPKEIVFVALESALASATNARRPPGCRRAIGGRLGFGLATQIEGKHAHHLVS